MEKFEELLEIQLLLNEDVSIGGDEDRVQELERKLEEICESVSPSYDELKLMVSQCGMVRRAIKLGDQGLCHARFSLRFEYEATSPLPKLLQWEIIPRFYREHIHRVLNTKYSTTLDNLYTMGYSKTLAREVDFTIEAVKDLLRKDGYLLSEKS